MDTENKLMVIRDKKEMDQDWHIHTLYIIQITNKNLLYSTGNTTQYSVIAHMEKESDKKSGYMYMYNWFTLLYTWS